MTQSSCSYFRSCLGEKQRVKTMRGLGLVCKGNSNHLRPGPVASWTRYSRLLYNGYEWQSSFSATEDTEFLELKSRGLGEGGEGHSHCSERKKLNAQEVQGQLPTLQRTREMETHRSQVQSGAWLADLDNGSVGHKRLLAW